MTNSPSPEPGWTIAISEDAAHTLQAMRERGETQLHDQTVLFCRALAIEAGAATDAGKPPPGLPMGDHRRNVDVPGLPILISYTRYPQLRTVRVTDLLWLG